MAPSEIPETNVTYEQLIQLEYEFNDAEDEIRTSNQHQSMQPLLSIPLRQFIN